MSQDWRPSDQASRILAGQEVNMRVFCIVAAALALSACVSAEEAPKIEPRALHERLEAGDRIVVLDVRTREEFAEGHIPGALNIPHTELGVRLDEVDAEAEVAVHCMVGPRARLGEETLADAGRKGILHIEGGFTAWQAAGLPVSRD
jgi:rhodanese-related sulfurtransferase